MQVASLDTCRRPVFIWAEHDWVDRQDGEPEMLEWLRRYARWLHTNWPSGGVEPLPEAGPDGSTGIPGVTIVGDLTGVPLLKFALDSGARAARRIAAGTARGQPEALDLVIVGAGVAGMAAAIEARSRGLRFAILEAETPFSTIVNFPRRKPIFTYPTAMVPEGALQVRAEVKEDLLAELRDQAAAAGIEPMRARAERLERRGNLVAVHLAGAAPLLARHVIVALGRAGDHRRLGVPGEDLAQVANRLHDPGDFAGRHVLVVGGGDAAVETAAALAGAGAAVTLACRSATLSRPKPELLAGLTALGGDGRGRVRVRLASVVREIREREAVIAGAEGRLETVPADAVFVMAGREAPLDFFRRSGLAIAGEMTPRRRLALSAFLLFCVWLYSWKSGGWMSDLWYRRHWFPTNLASLLAGLGGAIAAAAADRRTLVGTLAISAASPSFWYTLAYSVVVVVFGIRRIRRRRTPYVAAQTLTLMAIQVLPLFLLPEIILPQLDAHGLLPRALADALFPAVSYGHGREFWRAYGLILAWPLDVYNVFTHRPLGAWLVIGAVQTCVLIPAAVFAFGKGAYCGWICSCGALAETLGDTHRHKMPHGPRWNRLNLAGQGVLAVAVALLLVRIAGWVLPAGNWADGIFEPLKTQYQWTVDVFLAGVLGYGLYFWYSGRVWCRFLCPLAALMHVYARFSRFRIFADKPRCISCGRCTAVCHQGIDVMSFANRGLPMADPECVRCSACVETCPTGVLAFGRLGRGGLIRLDALAASPVRMRERSAAPANERGDALAHRPSTT
jgi:thioredoxin reductase/NAD-dependent dihydropyrimidine dehydrogenase PreA subunit